MKQIVKSNGLRRLAAGLVFLAAVIAAAQDSQSANQDATKAKPQPATAKKQKAKDALRPWVPYWRSRGGIYAGCTVARELS